LVFHRNNENEFRNILAPEHATFVLAIFSKNPVLSP
jgi:hypothetical protein